MKKRLTSIPYGLTLSFLWCILMLSACHTSRLNQAANVAQPNVALHENSVNVPIDASIAEEQTVALASLEEQPAAASTRPHVQSNAPNVNNYVAMQHVSAKAAKQKNNETAQVQQKLTWPAKMMLKSIAKKAEKLKKKDIQGATESKEVNNRSYLVLGIILLIAGLVAVLVGNTTLLYVLGSVASLLGLVFLLLAIL